MADPKLRFGADAKLKRNTGTFAAPVWSEIKNINEQLGLDLSRPKSDATIRGGGREMTEPAPLLTIGLSFKMIEDLADTEFLAIRAAFLAGTILDLLCCSGDEAVAGETYVRTEYKVSQFKKAEPVKGLNTYDVSVEPCYSTNPMGAGVTPIA
jgi:hypothetical protein